MSSTSENPSQITGQWNTAKGGVKEGLGRTFGLSNLTREGQAEQAAGRDEVNAARSQPGGPAGGAGGAPGNTDTGSSDTGANTGQHRFGPGIGDAGQMGYNTTTIGQGYGIARPDVGMATSGANGTDTGFAPTSGTTQPGQFAQDAALRPQDRQAKKDQDHEYNRNAF